jgi:Rod binding domain-containing protein
MPGDFSTGIAAGASAAFDALNSAGQHQPGGKVAGAARDFEALLLGQILKSAHGDGGWLGTSDDDAGSATVGLAEEQLAHTMASSGGLGLSKLIESGINQAAVGQETTARHEAASS